MFRESLALSILLTILRGLLGLRTSLLLGLDTCVHDRSVRASLNTRAYRCLLASKIGETHLIESLEETIHLAAFDLTQHIQLLEAR